MSGTTTISIPRRELGLSTPYEAPEGALEILIARLFAEVFDVDQVGANDDFFDVGGDSLVAETLSVAISEQTGRTFHLSALVEHGSPRKIAAFLKGQSTKIDVVGTTGRPPIFIVHGRDGLTFPSAEFRRALADGQTLYMFELPGIRGNGHCYDRIEDIASVYVAGLEQNYKTGPIFLASFCMGALIALEMAAQLEKKGRPIHQLVLLDPGVPKGLRIDKPGALQSVASRVSSGWQNWLKKSQRLLLRCGPATNTNKKRSQEALANKYRLRLEQKKQEARLKRPELQLSIDALAKLRAAYRYYRPIPFHGPVTILASRDREPMFRDPSSILSKALPRRRVLVVMEHHSELEGSAAGHMQAIFDAAREEIESQYARVS